MFWEKIKNKDIITTVVLIIIVSTIGIKFIENFPYFFGIVEKIIALLMPFVYGLIIAYILNPLVNFFEKKAKLKNGMAIMLTYAVLIGIVSLIGVFFIPSIIESSLDIAKSIPEYISDMQNWFYEFINKEEIKSFMSTTGTFENINSILTQFGTMIISILEGSVTQIFSFSSQVLKFFIGLLISIYVLIDKERFIKISKRLTFIILKPKNAEKVVECVRIYHKMICAYIGIKAIDSAIIGFMAFILLEIVNSEYAILLAVIVGVTNMIPYFGPFIGEIIGLLFNVFVSPIKGLTVFLVLLTLQMFDGWYLDPKLVGDKVGVRPFFIILAVVIGGGFYGPVGMLLAAPTIATMKIYFDRVLDKNKELTSLADKT
ncbi:MAG: AI-2E family transporter [Clostridium sp.]